MNALPRNYNPGRPHQTWTELECLVAGRLSAEPQFAMESPWNRLPLARDVVDIVEEHLGGDVNAQARMKNALSYAKRTTDAAMKLHRRSASLSGVDVCQTCFNAAVASWEPWPCPTVRALGGDA